MEGAVDMADDAKTPDTGAAPAAQAGQQAGQQVQVPIHDANLQNVYVNFFRVTGNPEDVVLDLGMHAQLMTPTGPEPVHLTHRVIMNFFTAKKLADTLRFVVNRHEMAFGVVE